MSADFDLLNSAGMKTATGKITGKLKSKSTNPKAPKGEFIVEDKSYTCWKEDEWGSFNEGDVVTINYKDSEWNGNINHNINKIVYGIEENEEPKPITMKEVEEAPIEEEVKAQAREIIEETYPNIDEYYVVMNNKKYKLVPTGDYLVDGEWKKV